MGNLIHNVPHNIASDSSPQAFLKLNSVLVKLSKISNRCYYCAYKNLYLTLIIVLYCPVKPCEITKFNRDFPIEYTRFAY